MKKNKQKQSKVDLIIRLIVKIKRDDIFALASQLAYYIVLSFFPLIIFVTSLLGYMKFEPTALLNAMQRILPESVYILTESIIHEILGAQSFSLVGGSVFIAIWVASSGFRAVIKAINKAYDITEDRSLIKRTIIAYISTIIFAIAIIAALSVLVFGKIIGGYIIESLPLSGIVIYIWNGFRYAIIILVLILFFAAIYRYTPCRKLKWREVFPGAVITSIGWLVSSLGFSYYINNFNNYSRFYGSLAAVFILMIWIFLTSIFIIFGVEVNSVLVSRKEK